MNKRKKVAWHKHLKARRMAEVKRKAEATAPASPRRTRQPAAQSAPTSEARTRGAHDMDVGRPSRTNA